MCLQEGGLYFEAAIFEELCGRDDPLEGDEGQHDRPARSDGGELDDLIESSGAPADEDGVRFGKVRRTSGAVASMIRNRTP